MVCPSFPQLLTLFLFSFVTINPFLMNIQRQPKSLQVAVFIFCDLLQESNLASSAAVCVMSIWICDEHLICYVHLCARTHKHLYQYNRYRIYVGTYRSVYTFIHNIVYTVSTGDTLNWVQTLTRVYLPLSPLCVQTVWSFYLF